MPNGSFEKAINRHDQQNRSVRRKEVDSKNFSKLSFGNVSSAFS